MSSAKVGAARRTATNHFKSRASPEQSHALNLVGLEGYCVLRVTSEEQNDEFGCVLLPAGQIEVAAIHEKRPDLVNRKGVVFHHTARPHTSLQTRQKLLDLGWDVLPHSQYSPDLAPSDYRLFRSLQNSLNGLERFVSEKAIKRYLEQFFAEKDRKFFERGIMKLPERWQKIVDENGQYIVE
ncbi:transposase [Lasius niger]|uniref:Transposase n=1 Tax=Lasius niger TaxID=67767 RepID=A0A0J7K0H6_LASNI|nr:transposase [Lasius niger]